MAPYRNYGTGRTNQKTGGSSPRQKTEFQCRKTRSFAAENHPRKRQPPTAGIRHDSHGAESGMTLDISGRVHVVYGLFRKTTTPSTSYGAAVHVLWIGRNGGGSPLPLW